MNNSSLIEIVRSFLLKEKNQKFKAHTAEATVSVAALKSRKTRLWLRQPRFFNAPLGRPLHASSVRPKQWKIENWKLKIYKAGLNGGFNSPLSLGKASRGAACCASIPKRQEKTANNTINMFVILLIIIGLCEMSLWGAAALRLYRRQASTMDTWKPLRIENSFSPDFMEFIC